MGAEMVFAVIPLGLALFGVGVAASGALKVRTGLALRDLDGQGTLAAGGGFASVDGTAETAESTVTAPLTGAECLGYEVAVQNRQIDGTGVTNSVDWNAYHEHSRVERFLLTDGTGTVAVEAEGADLELDDDHRREFDSGTEPDGPYAQFLADHDVYTFDDERIATGHQVRFVERRVEPGDDISVMGPVTEAATGVPGALAVFRGGERGLLGRLASKPFVVSDSAVDPPETVAEGTALAVFGAAFAVVGVGFGLLVLGGLG